MGRSKTVLPAGWWPEPSPSCQGPSVRIASSSKVLAAPSDLLVTLAGGKPFALLSTAAALPALLLTALVMPWNKRGAAARSEKPTAERWRHQQQRQQGPFGNNRYGEEPRKGSA